MNGLACAVYDYHRTSSAWDKKPYLSLEFGILGSIGVLVLIISGLIVLYFDPIVDSFIQQELVLRNGSKMFETWHNPPIVPELRIYFFNVTNKDEFLNGDKPRLVEVGPYTYRERWKRVNVSFHDNGTIAYQTQRFYFFDRNQSAGPESDSIITVNIPMVAAVSQLRYSPRLVKLALASMLEVLKEEPFAAHTVQELMWGYDDPLLRIAKEILPPDKRMPFEKFGLFYKKNGSADGMFSVFSGADDMSKYTTIDTYNRRRHLGFWGKSGICDDIRGTDGTSFPPGLGHSSVLYLFNENFCRSLPLTFSRDTEKLGVRSMRFTPPSDVFANASINAANECFCIGGSECSSNGIFNISACMFGSPTVISWPHFYQAGSQYLTAVDGLSPDAEKHTLYVDVSSRTGTPVGAQARLQINIALFKVPEIKQAARLRDIIFPVVWFEDGITNLPADIVALLQKAQNLPDVAKSSMMTALFTVGTLLVVVASISLTAQLLHLPVPFLNPGYHRGEMTPGVNMGPGHVNAAAMHDTDIDGIERKDNVGNGEVEGRKEKNGDADRHRWT